MIVVENKDEIPWHGGSDFIEQSSQNRFSWRWLRGLRILEHTQHSFSNIGCNRPEGSHEIGEKACWVAIPFVQRQPGGPPVASCDPIADEGGFTEARGGRDERQFAVQAF